MKSVLLRVPEDIHAVILDLAREERRTWTAQVLVCLEECAVRKRRPGRTLDPPGNPYNPTDPSQPSD